MHQTLELKTRYDVLTSDIEVRVREGSADVTHHTPTSRLKACRSADWIVAGHGH